MDKNNGTENELLIWGEFGVSAGNGQCGIVTPTFEHKNLLGNVNESLEKSGKGIRATRILIKKRTCLVFETNNKSNLIVPLITMWLPYYLGMRSILKITGKNPRWELNGQARSGTRELVFWESVE